MPVRIVQSQQNARLKELRRALAAPGRAKNSKAGIEGPNLVAEAARAGLAIDCVFVAQGAEGMLDRLMLPLETEILLLPRTLLDAALTTETPQPIAALVEPPEWKWADVLGAGKSRPALVVVLAGLQDPGNLGTILRSAEAFGATGAVSLPGTVSAWNPKAVRASAGSVFRVPMIASGMEECFTRLHDEDLRIWATAARNAREATRTDLTGPLAMVIGNEGNGLQWELAIKADGALTVPCPGPVESLNAAVAASVLLYEAARQRGAGNIAESNPGRKSKDAARVGRPDLPTGSRQ
jgi:TrmH family RNA methyltransferase